MQILSAAGLPYIGSEFPYSWKETIAAANPDGFYESLLRQGIYYATNPHPKTGRFLAPGATRRHAVKVFVPGLVKSDLAYLDRVIATVRPWRSYARSLTALYALEDAAISQAPDAPERLAKARSHRSKHPPEVEWFFENYALLRDVAIRRYPYQLVSYDRLLRDPSGTVAQALAFVGEGDVAAAAAIVRPQAPKPEVGPHHAFEANELSAADALYAAVDAQQDLSQPLITHLNQAYRSLRERFPD